MTEPQWQAFCEFREQFLALCKEWAKFSKELLPLQKEAAKKDGVEYSLENPVVYNTAYNEITKNDEIRILVVGDNPGKEEQFACNQKYLVGQSGRIAEGFFRRNKELSIDFRRNALILNKTPIHTAKTKELRFVIQNASSALKKIVLESQNNMAHLTAKLHKNLAEYADAVSTVELWIVGYAELKNKGLFIPYRNTLYSSYKESKVWEKVYVYQHFSMNRFLIDLNGYRYEHPALSLSESLKELGHLHRDEIFAATI